MIDKKKVFYMCMAIFLVVHMFYKVLVDSYTSGIFNLPFLGIICILFLLYFSKYNSHGKDAYVIGSFAVYIAFIMIMAITDKELVFVKRGIYEYGLYQMLLFAAAFLMVKISRENLIKAIVFIGFPFVAVGVIGALTYSGSTATPVYSGDTIMRIAGIARSPLSQGMLCAVYSLFSLAQVRISGKKWYFIPFFVGFLSFMFSGSRGPLVAFVAALLIYVLLEFIMLKGKNAIRPICISFGVLIVLTVLFFVTDLEFKSEYINKMYLRLKRIVDWQSDEGNVGRMVTWKYWFEVFMENKWFGIGMSRTGSWGTATIGVTESGFLRHLVELGIVGSCLYYNLILSCVVSTVRVMKSIKRRLDSFMILHFSIMVLVLVEDMVLQITEEITVAFFLWWSIGAILGCAYKLKGNSDLQHD